MAHKQSEQRSEQDAPAQETAMIMMITMMAMAVMAAKDHPSQYKDSQQAQHFVFPPFVIQYVPLIGYGYRIQETHAEIQDQKSRIQRVIFPVEKLRKHPAQQRKKTRPSMIVWPRVALENSDLIYQG